MAAVFILIFDLRRFLADSKEPLVPPRFLERFSNRKVKQGTSITLSVKVEGWWFVCLTTTLIWDQFKQLSENIIRLPYSYGLLAEGRINGRCPVD